MHRVTSAVLNEDILFLDYNEIKEAIDNPDKLIIYTYPELCLIYEFKPNDNELKQWHWLKKEFGGTIERRDEQHPSIGRDEDVSKDNKFKSYSDGRGTYVKDGCPAAGIFNATKFVHISADVFEFWKDYRKFRETHRIIGKS